jgi:hypothetical protein
VREGPLAEMRAAADRAREQIRARHKQQPKVLSPLLAAVETSGTAYACGFLGTSERHNMGALVVGTGVTATDIVKRLAKPAPLIEEIVSQWAPLRGIVFLNGGEIAKLRSFDWTGCEAPEIRSGERLVMFIRNLHEAYEVDAVNCQECHTARARLCPACAQIQVERIKAETRRYAGTRGRSVRNWRRSGRPRNGDAMGRRIPETTTARGDVTVSCLNDPG